MWVPESSCTRPPFSSLKWPLFKRQRWAEKTFISRSHRLSRWCWALDHKIVVLQSMAGEKRKHTEVTWLDQGHGGTLGLMEFFTRTGWRRVSFTLISISGGPEHEHAWQRTGSSYLPVPPPPAPASFPAAALAEGHHHCNDCRAACHRWLLHPTEHCLPRTGFCSYRVMGHGRQRSLGKEPRGPAR